MSGGVPCHFVRRVVESPCILMVLTLEAVSRCAFTGFCGSGLPREDRPVEKGGTHGRGVKSTGFDALATEDSTICHLSSDKVLPEVVAQFNPCSMYHGTALTPLLYRPTVRTRLRFTTYSTNV